MSEKRYQVFISSTFKDLVDERKAIMEAILNLDCFPSGMELFPASDMEQFEYIKSVIDESDYYVLVVAGKYGSISGETGISYTEMEYDYAKEKGIPIITFIKKDIDSLPRNKTETDPDIIEKLNRFREKISKNKMVKFWDDTKDLKYGVHDSLSKAIKIHKRVGWVRGDTTTDTTLLRQINDLRIENDKLKKMINEFKINSVESNKIENLSQGDDKYKIYYKITYYNFNGNEYEENYYIELTWNELFHLLGYKLLNFGSNGRLINYSKKYILEDAISEKIIERDIARLNIPEEFREDITIDINEKNLITILLQLTYLHLIYEDKNKQLRLTQKGKNIIVNSLLVKKDN